MTCNCGDDQRYTCALSNAPADTPPERLAWLKCARHFVERTNQDSKSEIGWDELQAQKYAQDPQLAQEFELKVLPTLPLTDRVEWNKAGTPQVTAEMRSFSIL